MANATYGAQYLSGRVGYWAGKTLAQRGNWTALQLALASYNAGPGNVQAALTRGVHPDAYTTGADYSRDVVARAGRMGYLPVG